MFEGLMADDFLLVLLTVKALLSSFSFLDFHWVACLAAWRILSFISALLN